MSAGRRLVVYADGGSRGNPGPAAIGALVVDPTTPEAPPLETVSEAIGVATNNVAEYRALIAGLEAARRQGADAIEVRADSQLVIRQLQGRYKVKNEGLRPYYQEAKGLLAGFDSVKLVHVPREQNVEADALANAALDAEAEAGGAR